MSPLSFHALLDIMMHESMLHVLLTQEVEFLLSDVQLLNY